MVLSGWPSLLQKPFQLVNIEKKDNKYYSKLEQRLLYRAEISLNKTSHRLFWFGELGIENQCLTPFLIHTWIENRVVTFEW